MKSVHNFAPEFNYDAVEKIWSGPNEEHYYSENLSIGEIVFEEMRRHPQNVAQIIHKENTILNKGQLLHNAIRIAVHLRNLGVQQEDIIGIVARNSTHLPALVYACCFNNSPFHALNYQYEEITVRQAFAITKPKIIFCDGCDYDKIKNATTVNADVEPQIYTMDAEIEGVSNIPNILTLSEHVHHSFRPFKLNKGIHQTLAILSTSGTTGTPKAVTITNSRKIFSPFNYLNATDVQYSASTLDWLSGLLVLLTSAIYGTKHLISCEAFDANTFLEIATKYQVTWTVQAPGNVATLLNCKQLQSEKLDSIRYYLFGGGYCTTQTKQRLQSHLRNGKIHFAYGFTEAGSLVSQNFHFREKSNSVGRISMGYKIKILNGSGSSLGPNELGEICCYSGQQWSGYYNDEEETKKMQDNDGWFHTGDLGYFDNDGFLYVVDRKKETLKYMGIMYYPSEIENVIAKMTKVAEVCVFGIWSELKGDAAAAAVVKRQDVELQAHEVIEYVAKNIKAKYKQLNAGALIVEKLIHSPNGKVNRKATKAHFMDVMGIKEAKY